MQIKFERQPQRNQLSLKFEDWDELTGLGIVANLGLNRCLRIERRRRRAYKYIIERIQDARSNAHNLTNDLPDTPAVTLIGDTAFTASELLMGYGEQTSHLVNKGEETPATKMRSQLMRTFYPTASYREARHPIPSVDPDAE